MNVTHWKNCQEYPGVCLDIVFSVNVFFNCQVKTAGIMHCSMYLRVPINDQSVRQSNLVLWPNSHANRSATKIACVFLHGRICHKRLLWECYSPICTDDHFVPFKCYCVCFFCTYYVFSSFLLCCNASAFVICAIKNYLLTYYFCNYFCN